MLGVRLTVVATEFEAETICGFLRADGIPCEHRLTDLGVGATDAGGSVGPREIIVPAEELERARELLDSTEKPV